MCEVWSFGENKTTEKVNESVDKDFMPLTRNLIDSKVNSNVLYVRDFSDNHLVKNLGFSNHSEIGHFRIDGDQTYIDSNVEPNQLRLPEELVKMNINLSEGFRESKMITDYRSYKIIKWQYFLKWINKTQLLVNRSDQCLPQFISFGGLFTSLLMTPFKMESWAILVCKHRGSIFMNKIRLNNNRNELNSSNSSNNDRSINRGPYYASKLSSVITETDRKTSDSKINEYEKYFSIKETLFGEHRLLLMNELDAVDDEGNHCAIKSAKHQRYGPKLLNWWSHCLATDIDYILIGIRDCDDTLKEIIKLKVEELPEIDGFHWNTDKAFNFVDRYLNYVEELLTNASDSDIYKLSYRKGENIVKSFKLLSNHLLPEWFLEGKCDENMDELIN